MNVSDQGAIRVDYPDVITWHDQLSIHISINESCLRSPIERYTIQLSHLDKPKHAGTREQRCIQLIHPTWQVTS